MSGGRPRRSAAAPRSWYTAAVSAIHDVVVIGAGPAGAATAARLHQQGVRDVLVLERYELPRDKPCGGGLTGHIDQALAALDLELTVPFVPSPAARVRFGSFERTVTMARPVQVIRRIEFDQRLAGPHAQDHAASERSAA